jgi:CarboxypepD_reg-like domain
MLRAPSMSNKIKIGIPNPCRENWETMQIAEKTRFCDLCQKNVIDFTTYSDREIVQHYNQNRKICGRFKASQIDRSLILPKEKSSIWLAATSAIMSFLGLGTHEIYAQEAVKTEQTDHKIEDAEIKTGRKNSTRPINGTVTDGKTPIPGVFVGIIGTKKQTATDLSGKYSIEAKEGDVLVFSVIGFKPNKIKLKQQTTLNVCLNEEKILMGEVLLERN